MIIIKTHSFPALTAENSTNFGHFTKAKESGGCKPDYTWCAHTHRVPMLLYTASFVLCLSLIYPICNVCMSTLYSKILGPRRQVCFNETATLFIPERLHVPLCFYPLEISTLLCHVSDFNLARKNLRNSKFEHI
jgi:hypothetical protein